MTCDVCDLKQLHPSADVTTLSNLLHLGNMRTKLLYLNWKQTDRSAGTRLRVNYDQNYRSRLPKCNLGAGGRTLLPRTPRRLSADITLYKSYYVGGEKKKKRARRDDD